jgi:hypothetical protein
VFTLGNFVKNTEVAPIIGLLFYMVCTWYVLTISKNDFGDIFGDFFTNASGHPAFMAHAFLLSRPE